MSPSGFCMAPKLTIPEKIVLFHFRDTLTARRQRLIKKSIKYDLEALLSLRYSRWDWIDISTQSGVVGKSVQNVKKRQKMPFFELQGGVGGGQGLLDAKKKLLSFQDTSKGILWWSTLNSPWSFLTPYAPPLTAYVLVSFIATFSFSGDRTVETKKGWVPSSRSVFG